MPFEKCPECQETNYAEDFVLCPNIRLRFQRTIWNTSAQMLRSSDNSLFQFRPK